MLYTHLHHGFGGKSGMYGPVTLEIDGEMKFYRSARSPPLPGLPLGGREGGAPTTLPNFGSEKIRTKKIEKKVEILIFRRDFKNAPGFRF